MYDIEVIDNASYAVIAEGSPAYKFLRAMSTQLVMKKLTSEPGDSVCLTPEEAGKIAQGFRVKDLSRLFDIGLLQNCMKKSGYADIMLPIRDTYVFTDYGLEVMRYLKDHGGDVEIRLN